MPENTDTTETLKSVGHQPLVVPCECKGWARLFDGIHDKGTEHHPNCPRVDDSLIDVWRVSYDSASYVTDTEPDDLPACEKVTKERMHRELYDALPEHMGF